VRLLRPGLATLSNRIAASVVVCVLLLSGLELLSLRSSLKASITAAHDRLLAAATYTIADSLHLEAGEIRATLPLAMQEAFESAGGGAVSYWVGGKGNVQIAGDARLQALVQLALSAAAAPAAIHYFDTTLEGQTLRAALLRFPMEMSEGQSVATVLVAHSDTIRRQAVRSSMLGVLLRQALFLSLAAVAIVFIVRRLLAPMQELRAQVDAREVMDDAPFRPVGLAELNPVTDALNGLLGRLAVARVQQERFVANASHQLRTPLSVLKVQLQSALREDPQGSARMQEMLRAVDRAARLTDQLLALAQLHQGRGRSGHERADLREVLDEAVVELSPLIVDKSLAFTFEAEAVGEVEGPAWMIGELLRNLLLNAIEYSPPQQPLRVTVAWQQGRPAVSVIDSGPGIAKDMLAHVFEPFNTVAGRSGGSGLGLAICKEIATTVDADLLLSSREDGPGLVARVSFKPAPRRTEPPS
jgi:two-component system, OmpR family, sensor histidine kinase TctE